MSWAEIKKAVNSDLSVPLNEYSSNGLNTMVGRALLTVNTNEPTPIFSLTGKYILYGVSFTGLATVGTNSYYERLQIELDGDIIFDVKGTTTSTYPFGIASNPYMLSSATSLNIYRQATNAVSMVSNLEFTSFSSNLIEYASPYVINIPQPILVKNSLIIRAAGAQSNNNNNGLMVVYLPVE